MRILFMSFLPSRLILCTCPPHFSLKRYSFASKCIHLKVPPPIPSSLIQSLNLCTNKFQVSVARLSSPLVLLFAQLHPLRPRRATSVQRSSRLLGHRRRPTCWRPRRKQPVGESWDEESNDTRPCFFVCLRGRLGIFAQETACVFLCVGSLKAKLRIKIMEESLATLWTQNELEICQAPLRNSWVCFRKREWAWGLSLHPCWVLGRKFLKFELHLYDSVCLHSQVTWNVM